jgi:hypothetical protein
MSFLPRIPPILKDTFKYDTGQSIYFFFLRDEYWRLAKLLPLANITTALDLGSELIILKAVRAELKPPDWSVIAVDLSSLPIVSVKVANRASEAINQLPVDSVLAVCPLDKLMFLYFNLVSGRCAARIVDPPE